MSLRTFHAIFIVCSIILTIGFGCWAIMNFRQHQTPTYLWTGIAAFIAASGLVVYEYSFLQSRKE